MRKHHHQVCLLLGLLFFFPKAGLAQTNITSFDEALAFARLHHAEFQIWEAQEAQDKIRQKNASSALLPQVKAIGQFDNYVSLPVQLIPAEVFGGEPGTFNEVQFGTQYQLNLGLEASVPLINTQAWNQVKTARLQAEASKWQRETARQQWLEQLARAYYLTLLSQEALEVSAQNLRASDSIFAISEAQYANGLLEPLAWNRLKAANLQAKNQYTLNKKTAENNLATFKKLCGVAPDEPIVLSESLDSLSPVEVATDYSLETQPHWRQSELALTLAETRLQGTKQAFVPSLSAIGRYTQQAWSNDLNVSNYNWFEVGLIGLRLEWSLFAGNQRSAQLKIAQHAQEIAEHEQEKLKTNLLQEQAQLQRDFANSALLMQSYTESRTLYEANYELAQLQFAEGLLSTSELLTIQQELWNSQNELLSRQAEYCISAALLRTKVIYLKYYSK